MSDREQIEAEIRHLLATETRTAVLSNRLFQQGTGLFGKLATTPEERRAVVQTELFRTAQARVRELEYRDAAVLAEVVKVVAEKIPDADVRIALEVRPRGTT